MRNPQNICLAAVLGENVIGTATAINYSNDVAWIGMVLVDQEYRGRGVSKLLLSGLFERLKSCRSLKLDATPVGQPVYHKFGFKDEYVIHRMTTDATVEPVSFDGRMSPEAASLSDIQEIVAYDKRMFGADRNQLIEFLVRNYPESAWVIKQDGKITGLALGRKGIRFHQIGPVLASTTEDAMILIAKSLEGLEGHPVVIDILDDKKELAARLEKLGFTKQRPFIRMYQTANPFPGMPENQFLICGPEFG